MNKMHLTIIFYLISSTLAFAGPHDSIPWEQIDEVDGIKVFRKDIPGSGLVAFKGTGIIDAPIGKVATILVDTGRMKEWVDMLREVKVIKSAGPLDLILCNYYNMPGILSNRDFVMKISGVIQPTSKKVIYEYHSVVDPGAPESDAIRAEIMESNVILTSIENGTKTFVEADSHADPKGWLPTWVVNMVQKSWPKNTINGWRKQVAKSDLPVLNEFKGI